ncbi:Lrp/AsnC family transcriptional regulator [Saccharopolyspora sp. NPDC050642]|uniref:Lrp/AsnC family transcriptional regulator n=1 Tax=Saccharopolyspora sp. NPDC050642 TaxID=3157099 RepID=UPI00340284EF
MTDRLPVLDELDRRIVAALQIDGRASWGRIARVLGETERTVARRATRLLRERHLAIVGIVHYQRVGWGEPYLLRVQCEPAGLRDAARRLAELPQARWVAVVHGSSDCFVEIDIRQDDLTSALLDRLAKIPGIVSLRTHAILRYFRSVHEWRLDVPAEPQASELVRPDLDLTAEFEPGTVQLAPDETAILDLLAVDGRAGNDQIAAAAGISASTAWRRVESLRKRGLVFIRADIEPALLGRAVEALLWLRVAPGSLAAVGESLAAHHDVRYLVATTGDFQLVANVVLPHRAALYRFLTEVVGAREGIEQVDVSMNVAALKRAFVRRDGVRLTPVGRQRR